MVADEVVSAGAATGAGAAAAGAAGAGAAGEAGACAGADAAGVGAAAAGAAGAGALAPAAICASTEPTATVSSTPTKISATVPDAGDGISVSTLSVDTSSSGSSAAIESPMFLSQRVTVPSVTLSPSAGSTTGVNALLAPLAAGAAAGVGA